MKKMSLFLFLIILISAGCRDNRLKGIWEELPPLSESRAYPAGSCLNGKIYITGGVSKGLTARPYVDVFDIRSQTYVDRLTLPEESRAGHAQVVLEGEIWLIGGLGIPFVTDSVISYNPATGEWTERKSLPYRLDFPAAEVVNGKIYVIGGKTPFPNEPVPYTLEYDPARDSWHEKKSMDIPRYLHDTAVLDGRIYVFGGQNIKGGEIDMSVLEYNPESDSWTVAGTLPRPVRFHEAEPFGSHIAVIGGQSLEGAENYNNFLLFNPKEKTWQEGPVMMNPRMNFACAAVEDTIYVFGGNIVKDEDYTSDLSERYSLR
ncbi:MAG: kelch repeat-containing protein [Spirochaetales bacterium]|nr:kelch repeat-containing protein [Spirochaetales bacterium]